MSTYEDTKLRFYLVDLLMRMPYGQSRVIEGDKVRRAWKPTGDHAPSTPETLFRALALAGGGNRPEESYTTDERITNDLDGSFTWHERHQDGEFVFHRKDEACPKCQGRKQIRQREAFKLDVSKADLAADAIAFTESWTECDMHGARAHTARISENASETQSEPDTTTAQESGPDTP